MATVAIIQARMGSQRLPGKVLADLAGDTMLARVVQRVRAARSIHEIVIATTTDVRDEPIVGEARRVGARVFRGSEHDVLARYLGAARAAAADVVVRMTSDCPLLDPEVIDRVVGALGADVDYASNTHLRTYPRGLDVEALHRDTLERIARLATSAPSREHVTALLVERPALFATRDVAAANGRDDSDLRWTVDAPADLALVRQLYELLDLGTDLRPYAEVADLVHTRPALQAINAHVAQKAVHVAP